MSTHIFSSDEINALRMNPCVLKCSERSTTYTYDFKRKALELHAQGVSAREIWTRAGFDLGLWRKGYAKSCIKNWKRIVQRSGFEGLSASSGTQATGRPKSKGVTDADKVRRLELQVQYLKAENDFLANLRAKRAESNSGQKKNTKW